MFYLFVYLQLKHSLFTLHAELHNQNYNEFHVKSKMQIYNLFCYNCSSHKHDFSKYTKNETLSLVASCSLNEISSTLMVLVISSNKLKI